MSRDLFEHSLPPLPGALVGVELVGQALGVLLVWGKIGIGGGDGAVVHELFMDPPAAQVE